MDRVERVHFRFVTRTAKASSYVQVKFATSQNNSTCLIKYIFQWTAFVNTVARTESICLVEQGSILLSSAKQKRIYTIPANTIAPHKALLFGQHPWYRRLWHTTLMLNPPKYRAAELFPNFVIEIHGIVCKTLSKKWQV